MMFDLSGLPERIAKKINGLTWKRDDIGMSGSTVLLFDKFVLKIEETNRSSVNERKLLDWLKDKIPVPEVIEYEIRDGHSFLLMSRISGEMACSDNNMLNIEDTVKALAKGLKMLWSVNVAGCPCTNTAAEKLNDAKFRVDNDLIDTDEFDEETIGCNGFCDVGDLYNYLCCNIPEQDLVFAHGDFCLPNIFVSGQDITGFIDWGNGGIADRWQDIALCVRSLKHNYLECEGYGEAEYKKCRSLLFHDLGIQPDENRLRYYMLLDELS